MKKLFQLSFLLVLFSIFVLSFTQASAATYYTNVSGTPSTLANWWTGIGGSGSHPANFTNAGDIFIIQTGDNMTATANWTVTGTVQINSGGTLTRGTNVMTFGGLTINGTITNSNGGSVTVNGNVSGTTGTITAGGTARVFNVTGNWTFSGTITSTDNIAINLNGTVDQTLSGIIAQTGTGQACTLTINKSSGSVILGSAVTTAGTITLTNGNIITGTYTLTIGTGGSVTRTNGYVIGNLQKNSFTGSKTFEVGTANGYTPVDLVATGTGNFTVGTVGTKPLYAPGTNVLQMYWKLTNGGLTSANLVFHYLATDVVGTESGYELFHYVSPNWGSMTPLTLNTINHTASISGIPSAVFAAGTDWTLGEIASMPVELTSFSATTIGTSVKLNWNTATEVNNYGFDIERSVVKDSWEKIGFINGNGNSNSPKNYSYEDKTINNGKYSYRLKQIDNDGKFEYSKAIEVNLGAPVNFGLSQNYPNPFNPSTTIRFTLPEAGNVKLTVFDIIGQEVRTLVNEFKESGAYTINFNASGLNSGMYVYRIEAGSFTQTRKMTLLK